MHKKKNFYCLLLIVAVTVLLRLPTFLYNYVNIDETDLTLAARAIIEGGLPYKDFLIYQPPAIYYLYTLSFWLSGGTNLWAAHTMTIVFAAGTAISLFYLTLGLTNSRKGGMAAALAYAVYSTTFIPQDMLAANCEILMMFPITLAALILYRAERMGVGQESCHSREQELCHSRESGNPSNSMALDPRRSLPSAKAGGGDDTASARKCTLLYFLSGILFGLGMLTKYQGGVIFIAAIIYLILLRPHARHPREGGDPEQIKTLDSRWSLPSAKAGGGNDMAVPFILLLGFLTPVILFIFYFYYKGVLTYAYEAFIYILLYAKGPVQSDALYVFLKFIIRSLLFALPSIPVWIGSIYVIRRLIKGKFKDPMIPSFTLFIVSWFLLSIVPIVMGGRIYFHYYFIILPAAAVLAGIWWALAEDNISRAFKLIMIVWTIICVTGWETYAVYLPVSPPKAKETWVETASYLKDIARPGDTLFVWGCCYQLYFFSGIRPGTRFTSADYLTGRSPMTAGLEYDPKSLPTPNVFEKLLHDFTDRPGVIVFDTSDNIFPKAWIYFKADMEKALPTYIIDTSRSNYRRYGRYPTSNYPYLHDIISKNYTLVKSVDGYDIFKIK